MLKKITLTNFRKHTNSTFEFGDGLHVMRGSNEAGKSTTLEAISYALFGVKAIRSSLADAVTWGEPESTLKVVLELSIDGVDYTVSRGKSGAEVNYAGGIVTGQTEVTTFMAGKLRVDAAAAAKLMMASQTDIRGALEAGPKATTELIERLAEFDQIDHLIELMQDKLTLGSTDVAKSQVESDEKRVADLEAETLPDIDALTKSVEAANSEAAAASAEVVRLKGVYDGRLQAYHALVAANNEIKDVTFRIEEQQGRIQKQQWALDGLLADPKVYPVNADERIQGLLAKKADLAKTVKLERDYYAVKPVLGKQDVPYYPANEEALVAERDTLELMARQATKDLGGARVTEAQLRAELRAGTCTFCGKDFSDVPEVQAANENTARLLEELHAKIRGIEGESALRDKRLATLADIVRFSKTIVRVAKDYPQVVSADHSTFPPVLSWSGPEIEAAADGQDYDAEVAAIRKQVKDHEIWDRAVHDAKASIKSLNDNLTDLTVRLSKLGTVDVVGAEASVTEASNELKDAESHLTDVRDTYHQKYGALSQAKIRKQWLDEARQTAAAHLEQCRANLKELEFNNALLKRVRSSRPVIADKLWNLVLSAVSSYFSEMRGFKSVVSKEADGFKVDGHPVETLSGSTLDILGLAIRVALVRTFLPQAPFLVLDEPMAGCDLARTESMLGFLVAVGFRQCILVTHEDVSESVADHIITLGE